MRTEIALSLALLGSSVRAGQAPEPERPWTMMVYGAADNNADGPILEFLDGVRAALDDDPGMELVLFIDRSAGFSRDARSLGEDFTGARVYRLGSKAAERLDASSHFPGMAATGDFEVDSADPANLERFVAFCKQRYPARHYGLMIYGHADGMSMCPDEGDGTDMAIPALAREVSEEASVDFLALELCNMGGVEIAYEWRPDRPTPGFSTDVLVAIPNAGPPLDWARAFARIRSAGHERASNAVELAPGSVHDPASLTPLDFGALIVYEGRRGREALIAEHPEEAQHLGREAAACYDLREAGLVKERVDAFARELSLQEGSKELLEALRDGAAPGSESDEPEGKVLNYVGGQFGARPYVDLYALAERASRCEALDRETRDSARALMEAVDGLVVGSFGMHELEGFEPGHHGVFISFPDGDREVEQALGRSTVWSRMGWYTPLAPDAGEPGGPYGRWAFLLDGSTPGDGEITSWFELLDYWFDDPLAASGGHNGYEW